MTDSLSQARRWVEDGFPDIRKQPWPGGLDFEAKYGSDPAGEIRKALSGDGTEVGRGVRVGFANVRTMAMRMIRRHTGDETEWKAILRFCVEAGHGPNMLRGSVQQEVSSNDLARGGSTDSLERPRPHRKQEGVVRAEAATGSLPAGRLAQVTEGGSTPPADSDGAPLPQEGEKAPVTDPEKERLARLGQVSAWRDDARQAMQVIISSVDAISDPAGRESVERNIKRLDNDLREVDRAIAALLRQHSTLRFSDEQVAAEMFRGENDDDCPGMRAPDAVALRKLSALWKVQEVRAAESRLAGGSVEQTPPTQTLVGGWQDEGMVRCVSAPCCGFTFADGHTDEDGGYSCPICGPSGVEQTPEPDCEQEEINNLPEGAACSRFEFGPLLAMPRPISAA